MARTMSTPTYLYLVSDGKKVSTTFEGPSDVKVNSFCWKFRCLLLPIGQAVTIYTDDPWTGTIGVYDTSEPTHVVALAKDMREHSLSLAERRIEEGMHTLFGSKASSEVRGYMHVFDSNQQRNHKWKPLAGLLWRVSELMKGICFRGE